MSAIRIRPYDDFKDYTPEEMWRFTYRCAELGLLKFPLDTPANVYNTDFSKLLKEARQIVTRAIEHGLAFLPGQRRQPASQWVCAAQGANEDHQWNRLGFCEKCGAEKPKRARRMAT